MCLVCIFMFFSTHVLTGEACHEQWFGITAPQFLMYLNWWLHDAQMIYRYTHGLYTSVTRLQMDLLVVYFSKQPTPGFYSKQAKTMLSWWTRTTCFLVHQSLLAVFMYAWRNWSFEGKHSRWWNNCSRWARCENTLSPAYRWDLKKIKYWLMHFL